MTVLTQTTDLLKHDGWTFHREGELISPDAKWIVKTGYASFESYLQIQKPGHPPVLIEHLRLREDHDGLPAVLTWLAGWGIYLGP